MKPFQLRIEGRSSGALTARLMRAVARSGFAARAWESESGFVFSCGLSSAQNLVFRTETLTLHQGVNSWRLPDGAEFVEAAAGAALRLAGIEPLGRGSDGDFAGGYEYARANWPVLGSPGPRAADPLIALDGETALAVGLIEAGCGFFAVSAGGPASRLRRRLQTLAHGGRVRVVEAGDALAAAFSAAGAGYAGLRAAAEPGADRESLGAPGASWAASAEIPFVLIAAEPGAPETFGGIVRAPASVREVYRHCIEAFDLAESYQTSVTLVVEPSLRSRWETIPEPATSAELHRGRWLVPGSAGIFARYCDSADGVSPRAAPGMGGLEHSVCAVEFDDAPRRKARLLKLSKKETSLAAAFAPGPVLGRADAAVVVARGALAAQLRGPLEAGAAEAGLLAVRTLRPFCSGEIAKRLAGKRILVAARRSDDALLRLLRTEAMLPGAQLWRVADDSDPEAMMDSLRAALADAEVLG